MVATAAPLTYCDALSVAARMRPADAVECAAFLWPGADRPGDYAEQAALMAEVGACAAVATPDGEPQCAVGLAPMWPGVWAAWMFATPRWPEVATACFRHARRVLIPQAEARGMWRAECHSMACRSDAHRFLAGLGFCPIGDALPRGREREMFIPWARIAS
jgi:hypothetical protein